MVADRDLDRIAHNPLHCFEPKALLLLEPSAALLKALLQFDHTAAIAANSTLLRCSAAPLRLEALLQLLLIVNFDSLVVDLLLLVNLLTCRLSSHFAADREQDTRKRVHPLLTLRSPADQPTDVLVSRPTD